MSENLGDLCNVHPRSGADRILIRILHAERKLLRVLVSRSDCGCKFVPVGFRIRIAVGTASVANKHKNKYTYRLSIKNDSH